MWYYIKVEFEDNYIEKTEVETEESFCFDKDLSKMIEEHGKIINMRIIIDT